jgi:hypothetical protein
VSYYPVTIVGFDLVGQEDPDTTLLDLVDLLLPEGASLLHGREAPGMPFFHPAGETDVVGGPADSNLYDALLLNTNDEGFFDT